MNISAVSSKNAFDKPTWSSIQSNIHGIRKRHFNFTRTNEKKDRKSEQFERIKLPPRNTY